MKPYSKSWTVWRLLCRVKASVDQGEVASTGSPACNPAVCGWLFPVLILPKDSAILQPSQLRAVLLHEFRHVRTADTLLTWLPRVLCAAFWFNPLLWYASRKWHEERELSCDEWVLRHSGKENCCHETMTPDGVHEKFPELSIGWVGHSNQPVVVKLPRGKGHVAYWSKMDDQWNDIEVRHPIQIAADGPTEITLPPAG